MFRQVRSGELNLKCADEVYTQHKLQVWDFTYSLKLCAQGNQPHGLDTFNFIVHCNSSIVVFGKNALYIKFITLKKKYKHKLKNLQKDNKLCNEKGKEENKETELTPGTQTVLFEEHVLSGCAEVFPTLVMLLSKIIMLWLLPHVRH